MEYSSADRVFKWHHRNVFDRFGSSFGSRCFCLVVLFAACCLLFWNEGQAVSKARLVARSQRPIREMTLADSDPNEEEEGDEEAKVEEKEELVHVVGPLYTATDLTDQEFGVQARAVKLRRRVEMFQWVEHQHAREVDEKGGIIDLVKFTYSKEWRADVINSSVFGRYPEYHKNPQKLSIPSKSWRSQLVKVNGLILSEGLVDKVDVYRPHYADLVASGFQRHSSYLYRGRNPYTPAIGDLRVSFEVAGEIGGPDETVSIIARKDKDRLMPCPTEDGAHIEMLYTGRLSVHEMLERAVEARMALRWTLRLVGWLLVFLGVSALAKPIGRTVKAVPVVGDFLYCGRTPFCLVASAAAALFVCAARWLVFRPAVGLLLAGLGSAPFLLVSLYRRHRKAASHRD